MTTPILILEGDKGRALQWLPWAEQQLSRQKAFSAVVNKVFKPVACTVVHIRSVNNIDRIRLFVCPPGEECIVKVSVDVREGTAPFETTFEFKAKGFKPKVEIGGGGKKVRSRILIEYGDGRMALAGAGDVGQITHKYREAGLFGITLKSWNQFHTEFEQTTKGLIIQSIASFEREGDRIAYEGVGSDKDLATAHTEALASCNSKGWASIVVPTLPTVMHASRYAMSRADPLVGGAAWDTGTGSGFAGVKYLQRRSVFTYNVAGFHAVETLISYIQASVRAIGDLSNTDPADTSHTEETRDIPQDQLKVLVSGAPFYAKLENALSTGTVAEVTSAVSPIITQAIEDEDFSGTIDVEFTSDFDKIADLALDVSPFRHMKTGWETAKPFLFSVDYDCVHKTGKSEYITSL